MFFTLFDAADVIGAAGAGLFVLAAFVSADFHRLSTATERLAIAGLSLLGAGFAAHLF